MKVTCVVLVQLAVGSMRDQDELAAFLNESINRDIIKGIYLKLAVNHLNMRPQARRMSYTRTPLVAVKKGVVRRLR